MGVKKNSIFRSSVALGVLMIIGYAISFVKESSIAYYFGVSKDVDSYTMAIQVPIILYSVFSVAIKSVLIPIYSKSYYSETKEESNFFISNFISIVLLISVIFAIIGILTAPLIIYLFSPGFEEYRHDLATTLLRYSFATLFCTAFCEIVSGILNVHKRFAQPAIGIWIWNVTIILSLILLHAYGILSAIIGNAVGLILEFVYMYYLLIKRINYKFQIHIRDRRIVEASKKTLPVMAGIGVAEINRLIDRMMASMVGVGAVSILNYASKINTVFASCLDQTVSVVAFPMMSESSAKKDYGYLTKLINICLSTYLLILVPITCYIILFNDIIVNIAFGRGKFTTSNIEETGAVLLLFALGLIFMPLRSIITNMYYSLGDTKTPSYNSMIGMFVNITLNIVLGFTMGVKGLALATSISYATITILLSIKTKKYSDIISLHDFRQTIYKPIIAGLCMVGIFYFVKLGNLHPDHVSNIIAFVTSIITYLGVLLCLRTKELTLLYNKIRNGKNSDKR